jgi:cytidylate kinase
MEPPLEFQEAPTPGFHGDRGEEVRPRSGPTAQSVALSREAGARGGTIARRAARRLGWQVYDQEMLEYMAQNTVVRQGMVDHLSTQAAAWAEMQLEQLLRAQSLSQNPSVVNLARVILSLGAQGEVVLIGRGAACILPRETTLAVRIVAPLEDRIAFSSAQRRRPAL